MKKRNVRTRKIYSRMGGKHRCDFAIEMKSGGIWKQLTEVFSSGRRRVMVFDHEYDACAKLLSLFERDLTTKIG
jgi:hypothetical protein